MRLASGAFWHRTPTCAALQVLPTTRQTEVSATNFYVGSQKCAADRTSGGSLSRSRRERNTRQLASCSERENPQKVIDLPRSNMSALCRAAPEARRYNRHDAGAVVNELVQIAVLQGGAMCRLHATRWCAGPADARFATKLLLHLLDGHYLFGLLHIYFCNIDCLACHKRRTVGGFGEK